MLIDHMVRSCDIGVSLGGLAWRRLSWRGPSSSPPSEGHCWLVVGDSPLIPRNVYGFICTCTKQREQMKPSKEGKKRNSES